jgi:hypothetical protein
LLVVVLALAACAPAAAPIMTPETLLKSTPDAMTDLPMWCSAALTNAASGNAFKIQDFKGKVVLAETKAMWCPTCLRHRRKCRRCTTNSANARVINLRGIDAGGDRVL